MTVVSTLRKVDPGKNTTANALGGFRVNTTIVLALLPGMLLVTSIPDRSATWIYGWPQVLALPVILLVFLGLIVASARVGTNSPSLRRMWFFGVGGLLVSAVVSLTVNHSSVISYSSFLTLLVGVSIFLFVVLLIRSDKGIVPKIGTTIGVFGLILVAISLHRWGMRDIPISLGLMDPLNDLAGAELLNFSFSENRNAHPFGHQNYTAGALLLLLPWHIWLFVSSGNRLKALWFTAIILDLICLVSTFSRGAWVGLAGGGALFLLWLRIENRIPKRVFKQLLIGGVVLGAMLIVANPRIRSSLVDIVTKGSTQTDQVRASMLDAGWLMFKAHPILGVGTGNVTSIYPTIRSKLPHGLEDNYQLHVTPLQIAAEQGAVGLIAWAVIALAGCRGFRRLRDPCLGPGSAAFFSLVAYGIFSLTDYQLDVLPIVSLVFLNLAVIAGQEAVLRNVARGRQRVFEIGFVTVSVAALLVFIPELRGRAMFESAMTALKQGQQEEFVQKAVEAGEQSSFPVYFHNQLAAYHSDLWANSTNEFEKSTHFQNATNWFRKSLDENFAQEFCYFNLGWMNQGIDPLLSVDQFSKAARLVPDRKGVYRGLALSLLQLGETNAAVQVLSLECLANPKFVAGAFWSHAGNGHLWPEVYTNLLADLGRAADELPPDSSGRRALENRAATLRWLKTGEEGHIENMEWPPHMQRFWGTLLEEQAGTSLETGSGVPWNYLHAAWADKNNRLQHITRGVILSTEKIPNESVVEELAKWVDQESWGDVIRKTPPPELFRAYGRQRSGFNLLARNMDGIKPIDVCAYVDNHVVELFFEFLYGDKNQVSSLFVLKRLEEILEGEPELLANDPPRSDAVFEQ